MSQSNDIFARVDVLVGRLEKSEEIAKSKASVIGAIDADKIQDAAADARALLTELTAMLALDEHLESMKSGEPRQARNFSGDYLGRPTAQ